MLWDFAVVLTRPCCDKVMCGSKRLRTRTLLSLDAGVSTSPGSCSRLSHASVRFGKLLSMCFSADTQRLSKFEECRALLRERFQMSNRTTGSIVGTSQPSDPSICANQKWILYDPVLVIFNTGWSVSDRRSRHSHHGFCQLYCVLLAGRRVLEHPGTHRVVKYNQHDRSKRNKDV